MKKQFILSALMAGLVLFSSCSEKDNNDDNTAATGQRLEKMTMFRNGEYRDEVNITWEGNQLQRVVQDQVQWDFNYENGKLTSIACTEKGSWDGTYYCNYTGNQITGITETKPEGEGARYTLTYNGNGEIASVKCTKGKDMSNGETVNFTWQNGNITQIQRVNSSGTKTWNYTYDSKNSAFTGTDVVFYSMIEECYDGMYRFLTKNNPLTEQTIHTDGTTRTEGYNYTYDDNGYPLTWTDGSGTYYFKYVGKSDPAPAY
jgi:hypothetical protein